MIIGIAGSFGAGKGAVVAYLVARKGFTHYSASRFITEEIERRGLPVNRDTMISVANELREAHGPSYIIDTLYERAKEVGGDVVIESLRAIAEVKRIKALGGIVIGVDADTALRYERSVGRGSLKDDVTFEKWRDQEKDEADTTNEHKQNTFGALKEADYLINNNGSFDALHQQIETVLAKIS